MAKQKSPALHRRRFLTGAAATAFGSALLRPLFAHAQAGPPKRILFVHRPCGTLQKSWWPQTGTTTDFQLSAISNVFEPVKANLVLANQITNARKYPWQGDEHAQGLLGMMTCVQAAWLPGSKMSADGQEIVGNGKSIDQVLAAESPALKGTTRATIQLAGARGSAMGGGLPGQRAMSYTAPGAVGALYPETRPDFALMNIFGNFMAPPATPADPATQMRLLAQTRGIMGVVAKDAARLRALAPASQRARLDEHLNAINLLAKQIEPGAVGSGPAAGCVKPTLPPLPAATAGASVEAAQHEAQSRQMLQIIRTAFQCDITRVATFQFANALSGMQFTKIIPGFTLGDGHHDISHQGAGANGAKMAIERFYAALLLEFLVEMKNTPDGPGTSLLDNTMVFYFTEIDDGNAHAAENIPLAIFGGRSFGVTGGRHVKFANRYINDVWIALANALGVPMTTFGDPSFVKGPIPGLFA